MTESDPLPHSLSLPFVETLYESYLRSPDSVPEDWRAYFTLQRNGASPASAVASMQERVDHLIRDYRVRGHRVARIDPLDLRRAAAPELDPKSHGFTETDMGHAFFCGTLCSEGALTLREIVRRLRDTYCRTIGVQFMHIDDPEIREWLQGRMESNQNLFTMNREEQLRTLTRLTEAEAFEKFVQRKFPGAKSFSIEGSESLIPLLDRVIEHAGNDGVEEIVLAMAHRGRLNVLANILGKGPREIFREFVDDDPDKSIGRGDVKYHLGHSSDWTTQAGQKVHLSICFNPSHLEFVSAVALGRVRAKQDRVADKAHRKGMALLIHGDASFAGQGVVQETLNLSGLEPYETGGTLHVVVNNQIGFTTPPEEATSSSYCTDVAKMLQIPVFHVNGEDLDAVAQVVLLAMDFRHKFQRDVLIDHCGYRRLGHSEGDEPHFTQPLLYKAIAGRTTVRQLYANRLREIGTVKQAEVDELTKRSEENLRQESSVAEGDKAIQPIATLRGVWSGYEGGPDKVDSTTEPTADSTNLTALLESQAHVPEGFHLHPKLEALMRRRLEMAEGKRPLDWATAEALAFATLATQGVRIRFTGQDTERGTFSQRHAVLHDSQNGNRYVPLQNLATDQAAVEIRNSPLSEAGVLGFEYGYSLDCPHGLVLWEAQFGDFCNAAQVIIDQFIAASEDKWRRLSGIVLLLPHGFEGGGPEHSSARLERFLQLAAEDNLQVAYPTTPAQYFHLLRRQALRRWRKPLIVMTPKSLLRHPAATSKLSELASGSFQRVLADKAADRSRARRILLCSGKIYYELAKAREEPGAEDTPIVRLEQLYPLGDEFLTASLEGFPQGIPAVWVQEEHRNMGAWPHLQARFGSSLLGRFPFSVLARPESASPATGSSSIHTFEQQQIISQAFQR